MSLKKDYEMGRIPLEPMPYEPAIDHPVSIYHSKPTAETATLSNRKTGAVIEVTELIEVRTPKYMITGDVPVDNHEMACRIKQLEKIEGCKLFEIHDHNVHKDLHPVCIFEGEDFTGIRQVWLWANKKWKC